MYNLKKTTVLIISLIMCVLLAACGGQTNNDNKSEKVQSKTESSSSQVTSSAVNSVSSAASSQTATTENKTETKVESIEILMPSKNSTDYYVKLDRPDATYRVLIIGDSLTGDSARYLSRIAQSVNYEIILGKAICGNAAVSEQLSAANAGEKIYGYTKNTKDFTDKGMLNLSEVLSDDKWEYVILSGSKTSGGLEDEYNGLTKFTEYVNGKTSKDCKLAWLMPWAYSKNYASADFKDNFGSDQQKMYECIAKQTNENITSNKDIKFIVPLGTAIQNIRTGNIGEKITQSGFNLRIGIGQYAASYTIYTTLFDKETGSINHGPCTDGEFDEIKKCVENALKKPYSVTSISK